MGKPKSAVTAQPPLRKRFERLPRLVKPVNYSITFQPDFQTNTFLGSEDIEVEVLYETNLIVMNAVKLEVDTVKYLDCDSKSTQHGQASLHKDTERLTLLFPQSLQVGKGVLTLSFSGIINTDSMKGLFTSKVNGDGSRPNYVTFFAPTYARNCFPCWDEPASKATFVISLIVPKDRQALSNMPVETEEPFPGDENLRLLKFQRSPIMSTYLVAFAIGDYDYLETSTGDQITCRVYTPKGKEKLGQFALDLSVKVLHFFTDYFGIPYPLRKMDLLTSADYPCGAMENWGLVVVRETRLLVDSNFSAASSKQSVALFVAHELAHQWFGNLVTMDWWTDIWLNEGFAMFLEYLCIDRLFPEWNMWTQFTTSVYTPALKLDALKSSHPIEVRVENPAEIDEVFDHISYYKGASIIRMLFHYVGSESFREGLRDYLLRYEYRNADTSDLWTVLENTSRKPVREVMSAWTKQKGFPLISVTSSYDASSGTKTLELESKKFWTDAKLNEKGLFLHFQWRIPITLCRGSNPHTVCTEDLIDDYESRSLRIQVNNVGPKEWVKVNAGIRGFYRVTYDHETLSEFLPAIRSQEMLPLDRQGILDDLFASVLAGLAPAAEVLRLMEAYKEDTNYAVWIAITDILEKLLTLIDYTDYFEQFKRYGRSLLRPISQKLGWQRRDGEDHLEIILRPCVLREMIALGDPESLDQAKKIFSSYYNDHEIIPADLRRVVYEGLLCEEGKLEDHFDVIIQLYLNTDVLEEKLRLLRSCGIVRETRMLEKLLEFSISDRVRAQDSVAVIASVASTKEGREVAWKFFTEHWDLYRSRFEGGFIISSLVQSFENFVSEEKAETIDDFFRIHTFRGTTRVVQQVVENIKVNHTWLQRNQESLKSYFQVN